MKARPSTLALPLSPTQVAILVSLLEHEPATYSDIETRLALRPGTIHRPMRRLLEQKLCRRSKVPPAPPLTWAQRHAGADRGNRRKGKRQHLFHLAPRGSLVAPHLAQACAALAAPEPGRTEGCRSQCLPHC